ncbi:hypothetical protein DFA_08066 [Cavenderia fasciculata]|uniref:Uncharacterized protein n=1 Tax=Cavenderia fasciculata TaxID=261658 RepID=F4Q4X8_CACFS|nr:uncharacterized protein DFA_08066 [Cavenderia fasciculata]EGG17084.1 hypothetical protein DFA_08066 [Cavenderia fasciculata]|eukprot:XP_004355568.1 hypothetical protein DFA_08066 [Cavenderia fasciculata]
MHFTYKKRNSTFKRRQSTSQRQEIQFNFRKRKDKDENENDTSLTTSTTNETETVNNINNNDGASVNDDNDIDLTSTTTTTTTTSTTTTTTNESNQKIVVEDPVVVEEDEKNNTSVEQMENVEKNLSQFKIESPSQELKLKLKTHGNDGDGMDNDHDKETSSSSSSILENDNDEIVVDQANSLISPSKSIPFQSMIESVTGNNAMMLSPSSPTTPGSLLYSSSNSTSSSVTTTSSSSISSPSKPSSSTVLPQLTPKQHKKKIKTIHMDDSPSSTSLNQQLIEQQEKEKEEKEEELEKIEIIEQPVEPPKVESPPKPVVKVNITKEKKEIIDIFRSTISTQLNNTPSQFKPFVREICKNFTIEISKLTIPKIKDINNQHLLEIVKLSPPPPTPTPTPTPSTAVDQIDQHKIFIYKNMKNLEMEMRINTLKTLLERWKREEKQWSLIISEYLNNGKDNIIEKTPSRPTNRTNNPIGINSTAKKQQPPPSSVQKKENNNNSNNIIPFNLFTPIKIDNIKDQKEKEKEKQQQQQQQQELVQQPDSNIQKIKNDLLKLSIHLDEILPRLKQTEHNSLEIQQHYNLMEKIIKSKVLMKYIFSFTKRCNNFLCNHQYDQLCKVKQLIKDKRYALLKDRLESKHQCYIKYSTILYACEHLTDVTVFQRLFERFQPMFVGIKELMIAASNSGNIKVFKILEQHSQTTILSKLNNPGHNTPSWKKEELVLLIRRLINHRHLEMAQYLLQQHGRKILGIKKPDNMVYSDHSDIIKKFATTITANTWKHDFVYNYFIGLLYHQQHLEQLDINNWKFKNNQFNQLLFTLSTLKSNYHLYIINHLFDQNDINLLSPIIIIKILNVLLQQQQQNNNNNNCNINNNLNNCYFILILEMMEKIYSKELLKPSRLQEVIDKLKSQKDKIIDRIITSDNVEEMEQYLGQDSKTVDLFKFLNKNQFSKLPLKQFKRQLESKLALVQKDSDQQQHSQNLHKQAMELFHYLLVETRVQSEKIKYFIDNFPCLLETVPKLIKTKTNTWIDDLDIVKSIYQYWEQNKCTDKFQINTNNLYVLEFMINQELLGRGVAPSSSIPYNLIIKCFQMAIKLGDLEFIKKDFQPPNINLKLSTSSTNSTSSNISSSSSSSSSTSSSSSFMKYILDQSNIIQQLFIYSCIWSPNVSIIYYFNQFVHFKKDEESPKLLFESIGRHGELERFEMVYQHFQDLIVHGRANLTKILKQATLANNLELIQYIFRQPWLDQHAMPPTMIEIVGYNKHCHRQILEWCASEFTIEWKTKAQEIFYQHLQTGTLESLDFIFSTISYESNKSSFDAIFNSYLSLIQSNNRLDIYSYLTNIKKVNIISKNKLKLSK